MECKRRCQLYNLPKQDPKICWLIFTRLLASSPDMSLEAGLSSLREVKEGEGRALKRTFWPQSKQCLFGGSSINSRIASRFFSSCTVEDDMAEEFEAFQMMWSNGRLREDCKVRAFGPAVVCELGVFGLRLPLESVVSVCSSGKLLSETAFHPKVSILVLYSRQKNCNLGFIPRKPATLCIEISQPMVPSSRLIIAIIHSY